MGIKKKRKVGKLPFHIIFSIWDVWLRGGIHVLKCMEKNGIFHDYRHCTLKICIQGKCVKCIGYYWLYSLMCHNA